MKLTILILGALVATAFADHKDEPKMPNMPDLNQLNNMFGGQMPKIPDGMKIDDLKDAFYNMPPEMKAKLNQMAESMGVKYDDIEDALNNPPEKLKKMFESGDINKVTEGMFNVPGSEQPQAGAGPNIADMLKNVDMGSMADMMKNVDINSLLENADLGAMGNMLKGVDIQGLMKNVDMNMVGDMMKNMDIEGMMKNMDLGSMGNMMKNMDIKGMMKNMDLGAMGDIMKNVDIEGMMKNMDLGAMGNMMKNMDIKGMMKNMDLGAMGDIMKNMDIEGMMKNMDLGPMGSILKGMDMKAISGMMKNVDMDMISNMMKDMDLGPMGNMLKHVDLKAISGIMKGKMPSLKAIKSMVGIPEDAGLKDIRGIVREKMDAMGIPTDNPMEAMAVIADKMKHLPLPEGMDPSAMLNQLHGQLEAMGMPEDPSKMKEFLLEKLGVPGDIKSINDLKNPEVIGKLMQKNVYRMLGIDENEDPKVVKDRIVDQLVEEAEKMGAKLPKDVPRDQLMGEVDKILANKLNEMVGLETESIMPEKLFAAAKAKLGKLGLSDFGSLKKHMMDMAMKQIMKKVSSMVMHMMMPKSHKQEMPHHHRRPPMMPPHMMMPHMMPPHMMMQPMPIDLDLDIEVNVEQPPQQPMQVPVPSYLQGVEHAVHHPELEDMNDEQLFHHIMAVREGLRSGEMAEEVLQEMIEDLMQARLRARVLSVRNMFLNDRLVAAEQEIEMLKAPKQAAPASAPARSRLLEALMKPRVV